jgi:hypothetical protein
MAQSAAILASWADLLAQNGDTTLDFHAENTEWRKIANEFTVKTRLMWQDGWFRDYDSVAQEWSSQQDTMHLAPLFCSVAGWGHKEQLSPIFSQPPMHSGWAALSWPPVVMTLIGAADVAEKVLEAAEMAYRFVDASYRSIDSHELDEHGGLPGVTREYRQPVMTGNQSELDYVNAGIEGYGWGALSIHLLLRYIVGLREEEVGTITIQPLLPQALRRINASYSVEPVQWGSSTLSIECVVREADQYTIHLRCTQPAKKATLDPLDTIEAQMPVAVYTTTWQGTWGEKRTLQLPQLIETNSLHS